MLICVASNYKPLLDIIIHFISCLLLFFFLLYCLSFSYKSSTALIIFSVDADLPSVIVIAIFGSLVLACHNCQQGDKHLNVKSYVHLILWRRKSAIPWWNIWREPVYHLHYSKSFSLSAQGYLSLHLELLFSLQWDEGKPRTWADVQLVSMNPES